MIFPVSRSLCAVVFVLLSLYAALLGYHEFRAHVIWNDISSWDRAGAIDDERKLFKHKITAQNLASRFPWHADFHFLAAKVHEWLAFLQRLSPGQARIHRKQVFTHLIDSVNTRPYWGRAWGAILILDSNDRLASNHQLERVLRLGRYDIDAQVYLIRYLFQNWKNISTDRKSELAKYLKVLWNNVGEARFYFDEMQRRYPGVDLTGLIKEP